MRAVVLILFFLSGACGLVYEVVWARVLTHAFGTTALAVGTVLAAFMTGMAAGGWLLGRLADRSANPLRLYAMLELGVALAAVLAHLLLVRIAPAYVAVYEVFGRSAAALAVARFVLAFVLVMLPTVLMGATLPVLARFVVKRLANVGAGLSSLYAINAIGAATGAVAAGFYLIGRVGIHNTVYVAALGNVAIGVVAWVAAGRVAQPRGARQERAPVVAAHADTPGRGELALLLAGFAVSGLTSFAYEIYWTRSLIFLVGNSTYALTTMLAAFLAGLALGGYLVRYVVERVRDRMALFGWLQVSIACAAVVTLPVLLWVTDAQGLKTFLGLTSSKIGTATLARFGVAWLVMLVPASLIGATFPLVGRIAVSDLSRTGATVGKIYAVNTIGNVAGALLPGVVLLHLFGIQHGLIAMALLNLGVGLTVLAMRRRRSPGLRWAVPLAVLVAILVFTTAPARLEFPSEGQSRWDRVLFYEEGPSATTKVLLDPDTREKSMSVDGVDIGGTGFTDYKQQLLAHLPKLLVDDYSVELSIGLGSGILVGESARHAGVREITCVEIEPSVVAGAQAFERESHGVLHDRRLRVVVDDVANHLRTTSRVYDVISADEKTAQDFASNGFSYSREYYALLRRRLAPRGVVVQWVPTDLPAGQYRMVLKTFADSFPHVSLWYFLPAVRNGAYNTILAGSSERLDLALARMRRVERDDAFAGIRRYGLTTAESVLAHFVAEDEALRDAVADSPVNTLEHPRYEFFSSRDYAPSIDERLSTNHRFLTGLRSGMATTRPHGTARLVEAVAAEGEYLAGFGNLLAGRPEAEAFRRFRSAMELAPWNDSLRRRVFRHLFNAAARRHLRGESRQAVELMQRGLSLYDGDPASRAQYGMMLIAAGKVELAVAETRKAVEEDPELLIARIVLANALAIAGRRQEAAAVWRALLEIEPNHPLALESLARL